MKIKKGTGIIVIEWGVLFAVPVFLYCLLTSLTVNAAEAVTYISDPLTGKTETITEYTPITADNENLIDWTTEEENNGYYVVTENVTMNERIITSGDIHLILADDATLTANSGIQVESGNSLTIYGQEAGTGKLQARGGAGTEYLDGRYIFNTYAAIGTGGEVLGEIIINGGTIIARANITAAAAIGRGDVSPSNGSSEVYAGDITINGGTVQAIGSGGAGIGSSSTNNINTITINGGKVDAQSTRGAGIGGGFRDGNSNSIKITGGEIQASSSYGTGIGTGCEIAGGSEQGEIQNITITGGNIQASSIEGAGIGATGDNNLVNTIMFYGGTIEAISKISVGIGATENSFIDNIIFSGGTIEATSVGEVGIGKVKASADLSEEIEQENLPVITITGEINLVTVNRGIRGKLTIEETGNLKIPVNKRLTIEEDTEITNNGIITNEGILVNKGTIYNNTTFYNVGTFNDVGVYTGNAPIVYLINAVRTVPSAASVRPGKKVEISVIVTAKGYVPEVEWSVENATSFNTKITSMEGNTAVLEIGEDETAHTLMVIASCAGISDSTEILVKQEKTKDNVANDTQQSATIDKKENNDILNHSITAAWKNKKSSLCLNWAPVEEADGYDIFVVLSKKVFFGKKAAATVTSSGNTSAVIKKINNKKLNTKKNYKVKIKAYRIVNGQKRYIGTSMAFHVAGKNSIYTNAQNIHLATKKVTLRKGRQTKIQAVVVKQNKNKSLLPQSYVASLRYESSNKKIATVTRNGRIKAKKRGTCTIYVTAANGVRKKIKVAVK